MTSSLLKADISSIREMDGLFRSDDKSLIHERGSSLGSAHSVREFATGDIIAICVAKIAIPGKVLLTKVNVI